jgi:replication factor C subunit 3/5
MFLIDKYRPKKIDDFIFNRKIIEQLLYLSRDNSLPHIIIYGPAGAGKKSLIKFFLESLYNANVNDTDKTTYVVTGSSNTPIEVQIPQSDYHIVIDPTNTNFDKYIIQDVVKQYAIYRPLNLLFRTKKIFKTILINNIDNLSYYAQASLRRTMELYADSCRFIMICNNLSKIIDPLKSRCCVLRVPLPCSEDVLRTVMHVSTSEAMDMTMKELMEIVKYSKRNVKKAIWMLENRKQNIQTEICLDGVIDTIIECIVKADDSNVIAQINRIRDKNYNILITNIKGSQIICLILDKLLEIIPEAVKVNVIRMAADAEFNLIQGRREIMHLDYFVIGVMKELMIYQELIGPKKGKKKAIVEMSESDDVSSSNDSSENGSGDDN